MQENLRAMWVPVASFALALALASATNGSPVSARVRPPRQQTGCDGKGSSKLDVPDKQPSDQNGTASGSGDVNKPECGTVDNFEVVSVTIVYKKGGRKSEPSEVGSSADLTPKNLGSPNATYSITMKSTWNALIGAPTFEEIDEATVTIKVKTIFTINGTPSSDEKEKSTKLNLVR